jgi:thiol:disulfide interchange protein DsbC
MTMNRFLRTLCFCLLAAGLPCAAQVRQDATTAVADRLQSLYPATRFGAVSATPWQGVFEVSMGNNLAYVDETGQYFLFGHLYDMKVQRDLTAERQDLLARIDFGVLPLVTRLKEVRGSGSASSPSSVIQIVRIAGAWKPK